MDFDGFFLYLSAWDLPLYANRISGERKDIVFAFSSWVENRIKGFYRNIRQSKNRAIDENRTHQIQLLQRKRM